MTRIASATPGQARLVGQIIGDAFSDLDVSKFLVPTDNVERRRVLTDYMTIWALHGIEHGFVDLFDDESGVAVWFPSEGVGGQLPFDYEARMGRACGEFAGNFRELDGHFASRKPEFPHDHLSYLAIRPYAQGQGLGTALVEHHHNARPGHAGYLEASDLGSRRLYGRMGYQDCAEEIVLPNGAKLYPMWRLAQGAGDSASPR